MNRWAGHGFEFVAGEPDGGGGDAGHVDRDGGVDVKGEGFFGFGAVGAESPPVRVGLVQAVWMDVRGG